MDKRERRHGVVGPIIVVGIGVLLLLGNLGMLQWNVWETLFKLWPLLLIGVGLDLAIGRRSALGALFVAVLMVAMLVGAVVYIAEPRPVGQELTGERVTQSLQGAPSAQVDVKLAAALMRVGGGAPSGQLLEGNLQLEQSERAVVDSGIENDVLRYSLHVEGMRIGVAGPNRDFVSDLRLSGTVPMTLRLGLGAGEAIVDLREMKVTSLDLDIGAGTATVTIPAGAPLAANLKVAVGELVVRVPRGAALRVNGQGGLTSVKLPDGQERFGRSSYTSAGYDSATEKIDLTVNCAIGSIRALEY
jgi:hypothetical protein